jgi:hypothetical protein
MSAAQPKPHNGTDSWFAMGEQLEREGVPTPPTREQATIAAPRAKVAMRAGIAAAVLATLAIVVIAIVGHRRAHTTAPSLAIAPAAAAPAAAAPAAATPAAAAPAPAAAAPAPAAAAPQPAAAAAPEPAPAAEPAPSVAAAAPVVKRTPAPAAKHRHHKSAAKAVAKKR